MKVKAGGRAIQTFVKITRTVNRIVITKYFAEILFVSSLKLTLENSGRYRIILMNYASIDFIECLIFLLENSGFVP